MRLMAAVALAVWRFGRIEEKWNAQLVPAQARPLPEAD